jgi:hypothetical protein
MTHIDIINASTVLTDAEIAAAVPALQKQINEHFYPAWGIKANLFFVPLGAKPRAGHWWMVLLDTSDVAGALGYHDLTSEGLPIGKVFAATDKQNGLSWTVTLSHELVEMLADPNVNLAAQVGDATFYSYETADAVEADALGYQIDGVLVSDFVFPEWFENMAHPMGTKFDHCAHVTRPLQLAPGGYISVLNVRAGGWTQLSAQTEQSANASYGQRPKVGSRRERRILPRAQWLKSKL